MARIRTIKPDFFRHERLYDAETETGLPLRLAFAGLWTVADRAGRFRWRPRALKPDILPYDDSVDFAAVMDALAKYGFVLKYKCAGEDYGYVPSWDQHQSINNKEAASKLPQPPSDEPTREARVPDASVETLGDTQGEGKGTGREGELEGDRIDDDRAKRLLARIYEILRLNPTGSGDQITWLRQVDEMLHDGLTDTEIIAATEVARTHGKLNLNYVRAVAFSKPKEAQNGQQLGSGQRQGRKQTAHDRFFAGGAAYLAELGEGEANGLGGAAGDDDAGEAGTALLPPGFQRGTG